MPVLALHISLLRWEMMGASTGRSPESRQANSIDNGIWVLRVSGGWRPAGDETPETPFTSFGFACGSTTRKNADFRSFHPDGERVRQKVFRRRSKLRPGQ